MPIEIRSIIAAFICAFGLHWYSGHSPAYSFGQAVGTLIIPFAVAYFASKGRSHNVKGYAFTIAAALVISIAAFGYFKQARLRESVAVVSDKLSQLVDQQERAITPKGNAALLHREQSAEQTGTGPLPLDEILESISRFKQREVALTKAFQESSEATSLQRTLGSTSSFSTINGLQQLRSSLDAYDRRYLFYTAEMNSLRTEVKDTIRPVFKSSQEQGGFDIGFGESEELSQRVFLAELSITRLYKELADLLEPLVLRGQVWVDPNGQLMIDDDFARQVLVEKFERIRQLANEQERLATDQISSQRELIDRLRAVR